MVQMFLINYHLLNSDFKVIPGLYRVHTHFDTPGLSKIFQCQIPWPFQWIHEYLTRKDTPIFRKKRNDWITVRLWLEIYIYMSKFQDFQGPLQKFQDFPGLESKFSNSRTFQVFKDLCKPCFISEVYTHFCLLTYDPCFLFPKSFCQEDSGLLIDSNSWDSGFKFLVKFQNSGFSVSG